jgi:hypothetical protein
VQYVPLLQSQRSIYHMLRNKNSSSHFSSGISYPDQAHQTQTHINSFWQFNSKCSDQEYPFLQEYDTVWVGNQILTFQGNLSSQLITGYTIPLCTYPVCLPHSSLTYWPLNLRPLCCLQTSGSYDPLTQQHVPENEMFSYTPAKTLKLTWPDGVILYLKITDCLDCPSPSVPKTYLGTGFVSVHRRKHAKKQELQNNSFQHSQLSICFHTCSHEYRTDPVAKPQWCFGILDDGQNLETKECIITCYCPLFLFFFISTHMLVNYIFWSVGWWGPITAAWFIL